ncbi:Card1-like endonuclease domain-containing protein [Aliarcobacter butzleri]|uniref:Card1-like endonuclease domain-containing protein n=1 Tax=Aliarcobacter butzleri TaxID=28197 RepID=UPI003AF9639B
MGENKEQFVKGSIFEEYIYWLIKDNFDVDDIMTGVIVQFDKDVNNEIDILIMKDNHLHTIECKFTDNFKTSEYLYKTDSIINYIDDDSKGMILSVGNKNIGHQDLARAKNDNINFYAVKEFDKIDFLSKVKSWFNV